MIPGWRRHSVVGALAALMTVGGCAGQEFDARRQALPEPSREIQTSVVGKLATLDNGIRLFVVPDPHASLIEFDVRHHVGARDDPAELPGLAHVVEHLMFEVKADSGAPIMLDLPERAVHFNAYTSPDDTHYQQLGPPESLEAFVGHAQARLQFDCEALDEAVLKRELEVVRNELRFRQRGLLNQLHQAIYPSDHPYSSVLADREETIARITREDVCTFVRRFYSPETTDIIIITGNVDPQRALQRVKERLGSVPAKPVQRVAPQPLRTTARTVKLRGPVREQTALLAYALPAAGSPRAIEARIAWQTAALVLPLLLKDRKRRRARFARFVVVGGRAAPVLLVEVQPLDDQSHEDAAAEVRSVLSDIFSAPIPPEIYDRARQRIRRGVLERVASTLDSADAYADGLSSEPARFYGDDLHVLDTLTPQSLVDVGQSYFAESKGMQISLSPDPQSEETRTDVRTLGQLDPGHVSERAPLDPAEAHEPLPYSGAPTDIEQVSFKLDNGLEVVMLRTTDFPLMETTLVVHSGLRDAEFPEIPGLIPLAYQPDPHMWEAVKLRSAFDSSGSVMSFEVGVATLTYRARGMSIYLDMLMSWFSERTTNAVPVPNLAFYYRDAVLNGVEEGEGQDWMRQNRVREALWGPGHPNTLGSAVTRRELRKVTDRDIRRWHQQHFRADNATLVIAGGFDFELVREYVNVYFGDRQFRRPDINRWNRPSEPRERQTIPEARPGPIRAFTLEDEDALQLGIELSFPLATTHGHDRAALLILAEMLSAEVQRLRRDFGVAYSFTAFVDDESPRVAVVGQVDGRRAAEATPALLESIDRLRRGDDFDRRFARARRAVLHRAIVSRSDATLFSQALVHTLQAGGEIDDVLERPAHVATATPQDVRDLVMRVLPQGRSVSLLHGSAKALRAALQAAELGPVEALGPTQTKK
ncbi:MAG: insulinase family protein [Nannocystaceae bacterium]|nr:insulinase family protein [Nannocystaceae bacterium]